jgi:hypothetical protein
MTKSKGLRVTKRRGSYLMHNLDVDPYAEGWDDHEAGKQVTDNPYKSQSQPVKYQLWERGWYSRDVL